MSNDNDLIWLEEVEGIEAIEWVKKQNAITDKKIKGLPHYQQLFDKADEILNSDDRIPYGYFHNGYIYNLWKDKSNPKGLYRRTTVEEYRNKTPNWETVLDLDKLGKDEDEDWVWGGNSSLAPDSNQCLIYLSRGGKDAHVTREFDFDTKEFISDGFLIEECKSTTAWIDRDTLLVGTCFEGESQSVSGYPNRMRIWKRGTDLSSAKEIYTADKSGVGVWCWSTITNGERFVFIDKREDFYTGEMFVVNDGRPQKLNVPHDVEFQTTFSKMAVLTLRSDWKIGDTTFSSGSAVAVNLEAAKGDVTSSDVMVIFTPTDSTVLTRISCTANTLYLSVLNNVIGELWRSKIENKKCITAKVDLPDHGVINILTADKLSDQIIVSFENFITPTTLFLIKGEAITTVKSRPHKFDSSKYAVEQHWATSKDGTEVPYFQIAKTDLELNGTNPTLQYGYGGFEIPLTSFYSENVGNLWLEQGGVYILTNIRGGGEFGPKWHQAALKENRQRAYDDFAAISEDLIKRGVTSSANLGIMGGSNGGLLTGVMTTQRPDLYGAVVCQVPLLDMKRYHTLLAGASWMGEYGNPENEDEWRYISRYSPLQNVMEGNQYPPIIFMTSTKDDRVHPGHARKMAAKMLKQGHSVDYFENIDGGHGGTTTQSDRAHWEALQYSFLLDKLK